MQDTGEDKMGDDSGASPALHAPDGGPAFPQAAPAVPLGHYYSGPAAHSGMTLRDYFAAKALQGMTANSDPGMVRETCVGDFAKMAGWAYMHADAMLSARNQD